jgi:hypothetical protein
MKLTIRASFITILAITLCSTLPAQHVYRTTSFSLEINGQGQVVGMTDLKNQVNYVPTGNPGYLVRIKNNGKDLAPLSVKVQKNLLYLTFEGGAELQVVASQNSDYLKFELKKTVKPEKIEAVLWGPFNTTINETIGEVVGVVRNKDFAIGIQTLNPKTNGGKVLNEEGSGGESYTASKEDFGAALQANCLNHALSRIMLVWHNHKNTPVGAIEGYTLEGSAIALFGATPSDALAKIGRIEVAEKLPHPMIDGQWIKTSKVTGKPYLIASFSEENFDEMLEYTARLGFYSIYHSHPFDTWGHFDLLKNLFPNGWAGMKNCVEKAGARNIRVGTHTLTNFITTNDPFVTTDANSELMAAGYSPLLEEINATTSEIIVGKPDYFTQISTLNCARIGNEIIRYQEVTTEQPYRLLNCIRGEYGTKAVAHMKGEQVAKLIDFPYNTLFPDWKMQDQLILNMATFFNATGVSHMDFDGHEGTGYLGRGDYGRSYFAEQFTKQVDYLVVNGSSNMGHYYWHINSYINWGEPWYASFRESQSKHRFDNQAFLERNYLPNMLGWFLMTPSTLVEDIEWMMARACGYNAGYAFVCDYESFKKNPNTNIIIDHIRTWEEAKSLAIFSDEQRVRLKVLENDFHLEKAGAGFWKLQSFDKFTFTHPRKLLQPGEPTYSKWEFTNAGVTQPLHLQLLVTGDDLTVVTDPVIEIDRFLKVKIPVSVKKGQTLLWDTSGQVKLYNDKGQLLRTIEISQNLPELKNGKHLITVDAGAMVGEEPVIKGTVKLKAGVEEIRK